MQESWDIGFISENDFNEHVSNTIRAYCANVEDCDLALFNSNTIDPIKLLLDKSIYGKSWEGIVADEIYRQRDKGSNNAIGYFHQNIFSYFPNCTVPPQGWDVIYEDKSGIDVGGTTVARVYVEMKNKHNTMNSASAARTYKKMQDQILEDDECACLLVEAIAKRSQDIIWEPSVDGSKKSHRLIRRVSMDRFYELVTGDALGFYKVCKALPAAIERAVAHIGGQTLPTDTAYEELESLGNSIDGEFASALYALGFSSYAGFGEVSYDSVMLDEQ